MSISLDRLLSIYDLTKTKDFDKALEICNAYMSENPGNFEGYATRADVFTMMRETDRALKDRNIVVSLRPDLFYSYLSRGEHHMRAGNYSDALPDFVRAGELAGDADDGEVMHDINLCRAECHARLGDYDKALALCEQVPDDHEYLWFPGRDDGTKRHIVAEITQARAGKARRPGN